MPGAPTRPPAAPASKGDTLAAVAADECARNGARRVPSARAIVSSQRSANPSKWTRTTSAPTQAHTRAPYQRPRRSRASRRSPTVRKVPNDGDDDTARGRANGKEVAVVLEADGEAGNECAAAMARSAGRNSRRSPSSAANARFVRATCTSEAAFRKRKTAQCTSVGRRSTNDGRGSSAPPPVAVVVDNDACGGAFSCDTNVRR